jgi:hypothetical protein
MFSRKSVWNHPNKGGFRIFKRENILPLSAPSEKFRFETRIKTLNQCIMTPYKVPIAIEHALPNWFLVEPHGQNPWHHTRRPSGATSRPNTGAFIQGQRPWPSAAGVKYRKESISFPILFVTLGSKRIILRGEVPSCLSTSHNHGGSF